MGHDALSAPKTAFETDEQRTQGENAMQAYRYRDEKSDKFWRIEHIGAALAINYGKTGTTGKYQIKEFDSKEACEKEARKLIASKTKKGYQVYPEFDAGSQLHIDDEEIGLHPLTSHPSFRAHFTEDFYYDCGDEEAPFGSDEGSDTLAELQDYMKKNRNIVLYRFPRHIMADVWDMRYLPPDSLEPEDIKAIIARPDDGIPMSQYLMINDQVIIASALGQIKIMGRVELRLRALALRAMRRLITVAELMGYGYSGITQKMIEDLESFQNPPGPAPSKTAQTLMRYLACPCEVFSGLLDDDDIIFSYEQALEEGKTEGFTPLLVVADDILLESVTLAADDDSNMDFDPEKVKTYRADAVREALTLDPEEVLKALIDELDADERPETGPVKGGKAIMRLHAFWNYNATTFFNCHPTKEVILARIPARNPWELPVYVPMGGFNDCPAPAQQAAVMKYWYEKYGAVPSLVTYDEWELTLPRPVADEGEALKLANEHYAFCYDRVEQYESGYTIGKLAHCLMQSTVWYFWWD